MESKKRVFVVAVAATLAFTSSLRATSTTIPSTYDELSGKWIGDVVALTNAITNIADNDEIILSRGEYDVSVLTNAPLFVSTYFGNALICTVGKTGVTIKGATGNPEDVVIDGRNCGTRVFVLNGSNPCLRDVTVKDGYVDTAVSYNWRIGGGVLITTTSGIVSNCVFRGCSSSLRGGAVGGRYDMDAIGNVLDCIFACNTAGESGGAAWKCRLVSGCTVISNSTAYVGGGLASCMTVTNCTVAYNYAPNSGGGIYKCTTVVDSTIESCSQNGADGGCYYDCKFRDNAGGNVVNGVYMERCDISGSNANCLTNINCVFHDLYNSETNVWCIGNVNYPDGRTDLQGIYAIGGFRLIRGCLITNCLWAGSGAFYNSSLFYGSDNGGRVENCTIADNAYRYLAQNFKAGQTFVNCAIVRNKSLGGSASDLAMYNSTKFCFSNCVWNVQGGWNYVTRDEAYVDGENQVLGAGIDPKFVGKGEHPYSLGLKSPLREYGMVLDWMAYATDFAGNARLRDGKVDVGCYECWLTPKGFVMSLH